MTGKCSLCNSRLDNGKCVFCGLDNKMYGQEYMRDSYCLPSAGADTGARKSESAHRGKMPPRRNGHTRINRPDFQSKNTGQSP